MGFVQTAFEFGARRPARVLDVADERTRQTERLERRLAELLGRGVALTLTDNSRTMVSARQREGIAHVRLHHMFVDADETTVNAVAGYLSGQASASSLLQRFIRMHQARIRVRLPNPEYEPPPSAPAGSHHDLEAMLARLNQRYFEPAVEASIGWARRTRVFGRSRRRSIKLGSYRGREALIRVHPVLDAAWVPGFFVEYIVYHEMLHHVIAMPVRNGRRSLHGPEFARRERLFERYAEAIAWERAHLDRLLSG